MNNPNKKAISSSGNKGSGGSNTNTAATAHGGGGGGMYGGMAGDESVGELSDDEEYGSHFFGKPDNTLLKPQKCFFFGLPCCFRIFSKIWAVIFCPTHLFGQLLQTTKVFFSFGLPRFFRIF